MGKGRLGPALVLGLVSVLALSMATASVAQTQRQRPVAQDQGLAPASPPAVTDARIQAIRDHLRRYKELTSQGRLSEAGKELEAIEALAAK